MLGGVNDLAGDFTHIYCDLLGLCNVSMHLFYAEHMVFSYSRVLTSHNLFLF